MSTGARKRPPLSPREAWISDGRQVLHLKPLRYDRWSQSLAVTFGEVMPGGEPPLPKKRQQGWQPCEPQWLPRPAPAER